MEPIESEVEAEMKLLSVIEDGKLGLPLTVKANVEEVLPGLTFVVPNVELETIKVELLPLVLAVVIAVLAMLPPRFVEAVLVPTCSHSIIPVV